MTELACNECGQRMMWKGTGTEWVGNEQIDKVRFECPACPTMANVEFRTFTPLPKKPEHCCCQWGAAVGNRGRGPSGEHPEFECWECPMHGKTFGTEDELCKRHRRGRTAS